MLSSFLRSAIGRRRAKQRALSSGNRRRISRAQSESGSPGARVDDGNNGDGTGESGEEEDDDEDGDSEEEEETRLLPIFSSELLDSLPVYNLTHSIRILIIQRCETTLTYEQLRFPQLSQFLVKPIQQQIRSSHFSKATLYALIANCLQFQKEAQTKPGNVGTLRTRAFLSELLAVRLLKEYSTRELIDALSYDFDPLQGLPPLNTAQAAPRPHASQSESPRPHSRAARTSTLEVAIRAQAKRFLSHPLVVQHLEAIWAGTVVFHSAADSLHLPEGKLRRKEASRGYGTNNPSFTSVELSRHRTVTLYNPRNASVFKLSRLRVPRYHQVVSTASFAVMLGLFIAVLIQRSLDITALEVLFWFWSVGFMLDEIVGFTEQGFALYILSVWNAFDLGILILFMAYYVLRLYGILIPDARKHHTASMAYDVLASSAVLLFPRVFSVLDHYRYFSQLLIAFRMMAVDLLAVLILVLISCSGFFVAFTLSFGNDSSDPGAVAYALFQILMGYTPAAWDLWPSYNPLGKTVMTLFLFICHFLIVVILITVLTNSFMAVVQNGKEEHQFLFAILTISMVKSDALFSYIAPANIIGWLLSPLRYCLPFRQFVKINRTFIKIIHSPILFTIFERLFLSHFAYEPTELVDRPGRRKAKLPGFSFHGAEGLFSPGPRLREPSVTTFHKDRALDEVFRRPFRDLTMRTRRAESDRGYPSHLVNAWIDNVGDEGGAVPPMEQPRAVLERLERRLGFRRTTTPIFSRDFGLTAKSAASHPEEAVTRTSLSTPKPIRRIEDIEASPTEEQAQPTDADGDDELASQEEEEGGTVDRTTSSGRYSSQKDDSMREPDDYFQLSGTSKPQPTRFWQPPPTAAYNAPIREGKEAASSSARQAPFPTDRRHGRNVSTNTIVFNPVQRRDTSSSTSPQPRPATPRKSVGVGSGRLTPANITGRRTPKPGAPAFSKPRPMMPHRSLFQSTPDVRRFAPSSPRVLRRKPSFNALPLDLASDIGDNRHVTVGGDMLLRGVSGSFQTRMGLAMMQRQRHSADEDAGVGTMGRIVLARMNVIEEGFRDILKEVRGLKTEPNVGSTGAGSAVGPDVGVRRARAGKRVVRGGQGVRAHGAGSAGGGSNRDWVDVEEGGGALGRRSSSA